MVQIKIQSVEGTVWRWLCPECQALNYFEQVPQQGGNFSCVCCGVKYEATTINLDLEVD